MPESRRMTCRRPNFTPCGTEDLLINGDLDCLLCRQRSDKVPPEWIHNASVVRYHGLQNRSIRTSARSRFGASETGAEQGWAEASWIDNNRLRPSCVRQRQRNRCTILRCTKLQQTVVVQVYS